MAQYQKGVQTRNIIIAASRTLFYAQGYEKTTMRQIAQHSNTSLGLINYYFQSKSEIGDIIYQDIRDEIMQALSKFFTTNTEQNFFMNIGVELYCALTFPSYKDFYIGIAYTQPHVDHYRDKIAQHIQPYMRRNYSTQDEFVLACIGLSALKPSIIRNFWSEKYNVSREVAIGYFLSQYSYHLGLDTSISSHIVAQLQKYHINMVDNFTPVVTKVSR